MPEWPDALTVSQPKVPKNRGVDFVTDKCYLLTDF